MNEYESENFERQLRRTRPARLPADFTARLLAAEPTPAAGIEPVPHVPLFADCFRTLRQALRWLIPATAMALAVMVAWHGTSPFTSRPAGSPAGRAAAAPLLKADDVKIDQRLVSSFDAVARLPGGEPVRFRCARTGGREPQAAR